MKIAQVVTLYRPDFVGGATLVVERLARGLRERGHEVVVFCGRPHTDAPPYTTATWDFDGVRVTGIHCPSGYVLLDERNHRHPEVDAVFARFLDAERPDVVHAHSVQALGAGIVDVAAARNVPVVVTMHDFWWFCARLFLVDEHGFVCPPRVGTRYQCAPGVDVERRRGYLRARLAQTARIVTPSRLVGDAAIANGVPRARVTVVPNGVVRPALPAARRRPGPVRFGYFGGPDNRAKGLPTLLDAAAMLDVGGWRLRLYGVAAGDAAVPAVVADRVERAPAFAPERVGEALAALDCLIVPSLARESYSLATREALAAGRPVIASDGGGPSEVVRDGANGFVVATGDAGDLAAAMRVLVLDPELLDDMRDGAAATVLPTVSEQVVAMERIYEEAVRDGGRAAGAAVAAGNAAVGATEPVRVGRSAVTSPGQHHDERRGLPTAGCDVLFIAGIDGAPLRYRVLNLQDQLRAAGWTSALRYYTDPTIPAALADCTLAVFYRVPHHGYAAACVAEARRLGRTVVFSCDDLVFDPDAIPADVLARLPEAQRAGALAVAAGYRDMLAASDAFIGATEPLARAAERMGVPAFVVRNGLGAAQLDTADTVLRAQARRRDDGAAPRLAYFSGTTTHDLDFAAIEPALLAVMRAHPEVRLVLGGYLRPSAALDEVATRIDRVPFVPWQTLLDRLAGTTVNLAPLRTPDPFADAKSEVKYLEAAAVGVPTVATATTAFRHAIRDGVNGMLATTVEEWRAALELLLADAGLRRRLGNAARDDVYLRYAPETQAETLVDALTAIRALPPRAAAVASHATAPADLAQQHRGEVGRHAFEPPDAIPGAAQLSHDTPSPLLVAGRSVGQRFVATAGGLDRIDVRIGTDGRTLAARLTIRVRDAADAAPADLRTAVVSTADYADGAWVAAEFAPLPASAGRTLEVHIESDAQDRAVAPTLWTYTAGWGDPVGDGLRIDGVEAHGSLTFRTFHTRPAA